MGNKNQDVKIQKFDYSGKHLFVYSDKRNVFIIFLSDEDNKLYKITTDKQLNIEYIDEIDVPEGFIYFKNIKFYKPVLVSDEHVFLGIIIFDDVSYKFNINGYKLIYTEKVDFVDNRQFNILSCLDDISITSYIQKKNKLYIVGIDVGFNDPIYGIVDLEKNQFDVVYHLYSDEGEIQLHSINTDTDSDLIYVCGWIDRLDYKGKLVRQKPYLEVFSFRQ